MKAKHARQRGYTLIEIVIVLAIAGLILIMAFLALFGAQRSRRDAQRKQDFARVAAAVTTYAADHNNMSPDNDAVAWSTFLTEYINRGNYFDPTTGAVYDMPYRDWTTSSHSDIPNVGQIFVQAGHWCNRGPNADTANPNNPIAGDDSAIGRFAVWGGLESGGYICFDGN